jgi:hypothetical protein
MLAIQELKIIAKVLNERLNYYFSIQTEILRQKVWNEETEQRLNNVSFQIKSTQEHLIQVNYLIRTRC